MGRAFEYRKARKLKRWGNMARTFTKLGKEIAIAVKAGGPDPAGNTHLRVLIQNAKAANMPKENVERAIKRATSKEMGDYKEMVYEGYAPFGIAMIVETATDNTTRTVANVRSYFNKLGGSLGTSGSVSFMFDHKCVFKTPVKEGMDIEELELELIDCGVFVYGILQFHKRLYFVIWYFLGKYNIAFILFFFYNSADLRFIQFRETFHQCFHGRINILFFVIDNGTV